MENYETLKEEVERKEEELISAKNKLHRKLIIILPKGHENEYYDRFSKAFVVSHDSSELKSTVKGLQMKKSSFT